MSARWPVRSPSASRPGRCRSPRAAGPRAFPCRRRCARRSWGWRCPVRPRAQSTAGSRRGGAPTRPDLRPEPPRPRTAGGCTAPRPARARPRGPFVGARRASRSPAGPPRARWSHQALDPRCAGPRRGQEAHGDGVGALGRQVAALARGRRAHECVGDLQEDPGAVTGVGIGSLGAAVLEADQRGDRPAPRSSAWAGRRAGRDTRPRSRRAPPRVVQVRRGRAVPRPRPVAAPARQHEIVRRRTRSPAKS